MTQILERHVPRTSDEQADAAGERVLYRLHHTKRAPEEPRVEPPDRARWWPAIAAAAVIAVTLGIWGILLRTSAPALPDGSSVEARSGAKWSLEQASDGLRIRLDHGSIIVTAASQRERTLRSA